MKRDEIDFDLGEDKEMDMVGASDGDSDDDLSDNEDDYSDDE